MIHIHRHGNFRPTSGQISDKKSKPKKILLKQTICHWISGESWAIWFIQRHFRPFSPKKAKIHQLSNLKKYPWYDRFRLKKNRRQHLGEILCWWHGDDDKLKMLMAEPLWWCFFYVNQSKTSQIDKWYLKLVTNKELSPTSVTNFDVTE